MSPVGRRSDETPSPPTQGLFGDNKNKMIGMPRIGHEIYTKSQTKQIENTTPHRSRNTNAVSIQLLSMKTPSPVFLGKKKAYYTNLKN